MDAQQFRDILSQMQKNLDCAICLDLVSNPVSTKCGHQFCRFCLSKFLETKRSVLCPLCKEPITKRGLQERPDLIEVVKHFSSLVSSFEKEVTQSGIPSDGKTRKNNERETKCDDRDEGTTSKSKKQKRAQSNEKIFDKCRADESPTDKSSPNILNAADEIPVAEPTKDVPISVTTPRKSRRKSRTRQVDQAELLHYIEEGPCGAVPQSITTVGLDSKSQLSKNGSSHGPLQEKQEKDFSEASKVENQSYNKESKSNVTRRRGRKSAPVPITKDDHKEDANNEASCTGRSESPTATEAERPYVMGCNAKPSPALSVCSISSTQQLQKPIMPVSRTYTKSMKQSFKSSGGRVNWAESLQGKETSVNPDNSLQHLKGLTTKEKINAMVKAKKERHLSDGKSVASTITTDTCNETSNNSGDQFDMPVIPLKRKSIFKTKANSTADLDSTVQSESNDIAKTEDPYEFQGSQQTPVKERKKGEKAGNQKQNKRSQGPKTKLAERKPLLNIQSLTRGHMTRKTNTDEEAMDEDKVENVDQNQVEPENLDKREDQQSLSEALKENNDVKNKRPKSVHFAVHEREEICDNGLSRAALSNMETQKQNRLDNKETSIPEKNTEISKDNAKSGLGKLKSTENVSLNERDIDLSMQNEECKNIENVQTLPNSIEENVDKKNTSENEPLLNEIEAGTCESVEFGDVENLMDGNEMNTNIKETTTGDNQDISSKGEDPSKNVLDIIEAQEKSLHVEDRALTTYSFRKPRDRKTSGEKDAGKPEELNNSKASVNTKKKPETKDVTVKRRVLARRNKKRAENEEVARQKSEIELQNIIQRIEVAEDEEFMFSTQDAQRKIEEQKEVKDASSAFGFDSLSEEDIVSVEPEDIVKEPCLTQTLENKNLVQKAEKKDLEPTSISNTNESTKQFVIVTETTKTGTLVKEGPTELSDAEDSALLSKLVKRPKQLFCRPNLAAMCEIVVKPTKGDEPFIKEVDSLLRATNMTVESDKSSKIAKPHVKKLESFEFEPTKNISQSAKESEEKSLDQKSSENRIQINLQKECSTLHENHILVEDTCAMEEMEENWSVPTEIIPDTMELMDTEDGTVRDDGEKDHYEIDRLKGDDAESDQGEKIQLAHGTNRETHPAVQTSSEVTLVAETQLSTQNTLMSQSKQKNTKLQIPETPFQDLSEGSPSMNLRNRQKKMSKGCLDKENKVSRNTSPLATNQAVAETHVSTQSPVTTQKNPGQVSDTALFSPSTSNMSTEKSQIKKNVISEQCTENDFTDSVTSQSIFQPNSKKPSITITNNHSSNSSETVQPVISSTYTVSVNPGEKMPSFIPDSCNVDNDCIEIYGEMEEEITPRKTRSSSKRKSSGDVHTKVVRKRQRKREKSQANSAPDKYNFSDSDEDDNVLLVRNSKRKCYSLEQGPMQPLVFNNDTHREKKQAEEKDVSMEDDNEISTPDKSLKRRNDAENTQVTDRGDAIGAESEVNSVPMTEDPENFHNQLSPETCKDKTEIKVEDLVGQDDGSVIPLIEVTPVGKLAYCAEKGDYVIQALSQDTTENVGNGLSPKQLTFGTAENKDSTGESQTETENNHLLEDEVCSVSERSQIKTPSVSEESGRNRLTTPRSNRKSLAKRKNLFNKNSGEKSSPCTEQDANTENIKDITGIPDTIGETMSLDDSDSRNEEEKSVNGAVDQEISGVFRKGDTMSPKTSNSNQDLSFSNSSGKRTRRGLAKKSSPDMSYVHRKHPEGFLTEKEKAMIRGLDKGHKASKMIDLSIDNCSGNELHKERGSEKNDSWIKETTEGDKGDETRARNVPNVRQRSEPKDIDNSETEQMLHNSVGEDQSELTKATTTSKKSDRGTDKITQEVSFDVGMEMLNEDIDSQDMENVIQESEAPATLASPDGKETQEPNSQPVTTSELNEIPDDDGGDYNTSPLTSSPKENYSGTSHQQLEQSFIENNDEQEEDSDDMRLASRKKTRKPTIESDSEEEKGDDDDDHPGFGNTTSSSAVSSQSEILTTQQQEALEGDLAKLQQEIALYEAQLGLNKSKKSDIEGDEGSSNEIEVIETKAVSVTIDSDEDSNDLFLSPSPPAHVKKSVSRKPALATSALQEREEILKQFQSPGGTIRTKKALDFAKVKPKQVMQSTRDEMSQHKSSNSNKSQLKSNTYNQEDLSQCEAQPVIQESPVADMVIDVDEIPESGESRPCSPVITSQRQMSHSSPQTSGRRLTSKAQDKPQRRNLSFVASGLSKEESLSLLKLVDHCSATFCPKFVKDITHVIMKPVEDGGLVCDRTLKFFQGIAHKCWVVSFQWVANSLKAGHLLPEADYEICGDTMGGDETMGPMKSRLSKTHLFSNYCFACVGNSDEMPKDSLCDLLTACGANVVDSPVALLSATAEEKFIVRCTSCDIDPTSTELDMFEGFNKHMGLKSVMREWILDSLGCYTCLPISEYTIGSS